jgi:hypothetical protein
VADGGVRGRADDPALRGIRRLARTRDPETYGKPLRGALAGYYRLRVGGYRVVYTVINDRVCVVVLAAGKRSEGNVDNIYDWLSSVLLERRLAPVLRKIEEEDQSASGS